VQLCDGGKGGCSGGRYAEGGLKRTMAECDGALCSVLRRAWGSRIHGVQRRDLYKQAAMRRLEVVYKVLP
jgi:hypothetical protein